MSKRDIDKTFLRDVGSIEKIDLTNPNNISDKVLPEQETRKRILTHARLVGCEREMLLLFAKYDKLIKNCPNDREKNDMKKLACVEMFKLLGGQGELFVNGQLVLKTD